MEQCDIL